MLFQRRPVQETEQTILVHSIKLVQRTLNKGHVISAADIRLLQANGYDAIVVAALEEGDVGEDSAAELLAQAVRGEHLESGTPFTGRCNLRAGRAGLLLLHGETIDQINRVHESITIATLAPFSAVTPKQLVATVKIIPYAVNRQPLDACIETARMHSPVLRIAPFGAKGIGFIQTRLPGTREVVLDKTSGVLARRLQRLHCRIQQEDRCGHDEAALVTAITRQLESGVEMVIIAGASATADRRDVVPAAIEMAGGEVIHFGMPVDPGNLLLLARHGERPVLGMPGCARSPKLNGFDTVLERLAADIPVSAQDIMGMGRGGLLKEIATRPQSRSEGAQRESRDIPFSRDDAAQARITALVLAAGTSSRAGDVNKLLLDVDGLPMINHAVQAAMNSRADEVIVVTGFEHERIHAALDGAAVRTVHNPDYVAGMSTSLAAGLKAMGDDADGVIVCLADMPRVTAQHIDQLISAFEPVEGRDICVPVYHGKRGNPVLWSRRFQHEMAGLSGDTGARQLLKEYSDVVCEVEMPDPGVLFDIDSAGIAK